MPHGSSTVGRHINLVSNQYPGAFELFWQKNEQTQLLFNTISEGAVPTHDYPNVYSWPQNRGYIGKLVKPMILCENFHGNS